MPTLSLSSLYAARVEGITGSVIDSSTSLLQRQTHDIVRMAMGSPAAEAIPSATFGALLAELAADGPSAFDYGPTEGDRALRHALIEIRQDLIAADEGAEEWAERFARLLGPLAAQEALRSPQHYGSRTRERLRRHRGKG